MRTTRDRRRVYLYPVDDFLDRIRPAMASFFHGDLSALPLDPTFDEYWVLHLAIRGYDLATEFGYGDISELARARTQIYTRTGTWIGGILDVWLTLYHTCRGTHHTGDLPPEAEWRSQYHALRERLQNPGLGDPMFMGSRPDRDRERPSDLSGRFLGALLGLAVGDALGTTVEFQTPGRFEPVVDMVGGGPFRLAPGQWTDDTSMALCLAESLIEDGFQPESQMKRYLRWYREGYLSSTGRCFDIGVTVREALEAFESAGNPVAGSTDPRKAGNGSLMRLAPLPLFLYQDPATAIHLAGESSRVTHGATTAVDACRFFSGLLIGALKGYGKEDLLAPVFSPIDGYYQAHPLCAEIATIAQGSFKRKQPPEIRGTGYVVESLEAALWAFDRAESFEDTVLLAVNLGHDADTTAAIAGQLAGAYYGVEAIPSRWRDRLAMREVIERLAWDLYRRGLEDHDLAFWGQNTEREPD